MNKFLLLTFLLIVAPALSFAAFQSGYNQGFKMGQQQAWNQTAEAKIGKIGSLLKRYTYEYRLTGAVVELGSGYIIVQKGNTSKRFDTKETAFILGAKMLSIEDNINTHTPQTQISSDQDKQKNFKPGTEAVLITRARLLGDPLVLTQVMRLD